MMKVRILFFVMIFLSVVGCSPLGGDFTEDEISLINSGETPVMRVLTTESHDDVKVLRSSSKPLSDNALQTEEFALLCKRMLATVKSPDNDGVGIAAPQVGILRRLVAVQRFDKDGSPFEFYANPEIVRYGSEMIPGDEGCLSVPSRRGIVERYQEIDLRYRTLSGKDTLETIQGFTAVIFQHELDHLDGRLYIDKTVDDLYSDGHVSRKKAEDLSQMAWKYVLADKMKELRPMWEKRRIEYDEFMMPIDVKVYGDKPEDGRSLYISMHGGGAVPGPMNDGQWENQKHLYKPTEGVYVSPRAAVNDWNMWFRPHVDTMFRMIINAAVSEMDVNPNKVYLTGYSAGGDGVYRMAPRMADRWAAASMMAGHPGEASMVNLRNVGFMIWMGENDSSYNRNGLAVEFGAKLDSLQNADPQGYIHKTTIVEGCGHWMNRADTAAISWMSGFVRNPYPSKVVWRQEETCQSDHFYYLSVPSDEVAPAKELHVSYEGNTIVIHRSDYARFHIHLNDKFINLSKNVKIIRNGNIIFNGKIARRPSFIMNTARKWMDPDYIFPSVIEVEGEKAISL